MERVSPIVHAVSENAQVPGDAAACVNFVNIPTVMVRIVISAVSRRQNPGASVGEFLDWVNGVERPTSAVGS